MSVLFFVFFSSVHAAAPAVVGARGRQDAGISRADELIAEQRYNEALALLTTIAHDTPLQFENAQKRIRSVIKLTESYNRQANKLIDVAEVDPQNEEEILKISAKISQEERAAARNENTRNVITRIYIAARFPEHAGRLTEIMLQARALLDRGEYVSALRKYQTAFPLFRPEWRRLVTGKDTETQTLRYIQNIELYTENLTRTVYALRFLPGQISGAGAADEKNVLAGVYAGFTPELENLIRIKGAVADMSGYFQGEGAALEAAGGKSGASRYPYMLSFLIHGRENQTVREGVLGVYDAVWRASYPGLEAAFQTAAARAYENAAAALEGERYQDAITFSRKGLELSAALSKLLHEYTAYTAPDDIERLAAPELSVPKEKSLLYLNTYYTAKTFAYFSDAAGAAVAYKKLMDSGARRDMLAEWRGGRASLQEALALETKKRTELSALANTLAVDLDAVKTDLRALPVYTNTIHTGGAATALGTAQKELQHWAGIVYADEHAGVARYYALQNATLEENLTQMEGVVASAQALMNGTKKTTENGEAFIAHYPAEALAEMNGIASQMASALESAAGLLVSYDAESERLTRGHDIRRLRSQTASLQRSLATLDTRVTNRSALAKERSDEAAQLRQEGDRFLALAKEALRSRDFDKARVNTAQTAERYNASLAIQEAEALRRIWDDQLTPLNTEIARTEYEVVVGEVRALVTRARARYFDGEYENAEELLLRAVSRWAVVSTTPESEVAYWLSMVRGALSLQSGRVIPATAPLYKSMSQLLNGAQKNYQSALAALETGKQADAEKRLKQAKAQLREVMILFPINREAGVLDLRIDQLLDAADFERVFETRFANAVTETKRGSREAYADMQNLAAVRPDYPGIERALFQAEIDIGLRQPPQDTSASTRAAELARRAQGMLDTPSQHNTALDLVNEALRLNPNSTLAMGVKDRLQVAMARQNVAVVDRNAEQDYMRAVSELQKGNTIIALSIVQRLLQNPSNRNSVKINELRRRIEAMM